MTAVLMKGAPLAERVREEVRADVAALGSVGLATVLVGGVIGVVGGLAMLGGCVVAFRQYGLKGGAIAVLVALGARLAGTPLIIALAWGALAGGGDASADAPERDG